MSPQALARVFARALAVWYVFRGRPVAWRVTVRGRFVNDYGVNWLRYECTELPADVADQDGDEIRMRAHP